MTAREAHSTTGPYAVGVVLADAGEGEGVISAELDLPSLRKYREGLPFLADLQM